MFWIKSKLWLKRICIYVEISLEKGIPVWQTQVAGDIWETSCDGMCAFKIWYVSEGNAFHGINKSKFEVDKDFRKLIDIYFSILFEKVSTKRMKYVNYQSSLLLYVVSSYFDQRNSALIIYAMYYRLIHKMTSIACACTVIYI